MRVCKVATTTTVRRMIGIVAEANVVTARILKHEPPNVLTLVGGVALPPPLLFRPPPRGRLLSPTSSRRLLRRLAFGHHNLQRPTRQHRLVKVPIGG